MSIPKSEIFDTNNCLTIVVLHAQNQIHNFAQNDMIIDMRSA